MSYLDPTLPQADPYAPGQDQDSESEKDQASWLAPFQEYFSRDHSAHRALSKAEMTDVDRAMVAKGFMDDPEYAWAQPIYVSAAAREVFDSFPSDSSAQAVNGLPVSPQTVDYFNANLAKHYGMDSNTAYQEALANTAYQRAVADMKRAGLNPASIFGAGRGQTAGGVGYVGSNNSGSGYAQDEDEYGLSKSGYSLLTGLLGVGAVAALKSIHNPYVRFIIGTSAAKGIAGLIGIAQGK